MKGIAICLGLGFGLIYLPAIVSVGYYFEDRRALATGLAVSGSGLGAFIFNPFSKYLIDEFGWRGAILIEAGLILNCVLCGALFRPLVNSKKVKHSKGNDTETNDVKLKEIEPLMLKDSEMLKQHMDMELVVGDGDQSASQPSSPTHKVPQLNFLEGPKRLDGSLFSSEGSLHRPSHKPVNPSPLLLDASAESRQPPAMQRLLSETTHRHRTTSHHSHLSLGKW